MREINGSEEQKQAGTDFALALPDDSGVRRGSEGSFRAWIPVLSPYNSLRSCLETNPGLFSINSPSSEVATQLYICPFDSFPLVAARRMSLKSSVTFRGSIGFMVRWLLLYLLRRWRMMMTMMTANRSKMSAARAPMIIPIYSSSRFFSAFSVVLRLTSSTWSMVSVGTPGRETDAINSLLDMSHQ